MKRSVLILLVLSSCVSAPQISVKEADSRTGALLQAISIVDEKVAWVSGHHATFLRTTDAGESWRVFAHEVDTLQFRDLHAFDEDRVVLMSAGPGAASRIFIFSVKDGWKETYAMPFPEGFLNTIEFWDHRTGLAYGDSFGGELFVLKTVDGGESWRRIDPSALPEAGEGEGGFAASGTCITVQPGGKAWIGTGAGGNSRVLYTSDYGLSWQQREVPTVRGNMAGIFSIRMADGDLGTISGGDLAINEIYMDNLAVTTDGGMTWQLAKHPVTRGTFYGSDFLTVKGELLWMICSPRGLDYSFDRGQSWQNLDTLNYWAVDIHPAGYGYAVGGEGRIVRISVE